MDIFNVFDVRRGIRSHLFHERPFHFPSASWSRHGELAWELDFELVKGRASAGVVRLDDGEETQACEGEQRLVAALGVFFGVVGHADHFGDGDGVEAAEGLGGRTLV